MRPSFTKENKVSGGDFESTFGTGGWVLGGKTTKNQWLNGEAGRVRRHLFWTGALILTVSPQAVAP